MWTDTQYGQPVLYLAPGEELPPRNALADDGFWTTPMAAHGSNVPPGATLIAYWMEYKRPAIVPSPALAPYFDKPRWLVWVRGTQSAKGGKAPLHCHEQRGGEGIDKDPAAWGTLEQANHRYRSAIAVQIREGSDEKRWTVDGIGLTVTKSDPLCCIDIDPYKEGFPKEPFGPALWAAIKREQWHTHKSPSGRGAHIIGYLKDECLQKQVQAQVDAEHNSISIMNAHCYVSITGETLVHGGLHDISNLIGWLLPRFEHKKVTLFDGAKHTRVLEDDADDAEVNAAIAKLRASGQSRKFNKLFDQRDDAFMTAEFGRDGRSKDTAKQAEKEANGITWQRFSAWQSFATILVAHGLSDAVIKRLMLMSWMQCDNKFNEVKVSDFAAYIIDKVREKNKKSADELRRKHNI